MGNEKYNFNRQTDFVTWLRAFAVVSILLCHYVPESTNAYIQMSAQLFNIGVNIFFIISGFCFGLQGEIKEVILSILLYTFFSRMFNAYAASCSES